MRALVIEDEAKTAAYLRQGLSENGFMAAETDCSPESGKRGQVATVSLFHGSFCFRASHRHPPTG